MVLPEPVGAGLLSEQTKFSPMLFTMETPPVFLLISALMKLFPETVTPFRWNDLFLIGGL